MPKSALLNYSCIFSVKCSCRTRPSVKVSWRLCCFLSQSLSPLWISFLALANCFTSLLTIKWESSAAGLHRGVVRIHGCSAPGGGGVSCREPKGQRGRKGFCEALQSHPKHKDLPALGDFCCLGCLSAKQYGMT